MAIVAAESRAQVQAAAALFREYQQWLNVDLCFQGFEQELAELPGAYVPPLGALLLAVDDAFPKEEAASASTAAILGCVALRPFESSEVAELKRLYVRPEGRGKKLGLGLTCRALDLACSAGYQRVRLDTLPTMEAAVALYRSLGFREIDAYRFNPVDGTLYLELDLANYQQHESRQAVSGGR